MIERVLTDMLCPCVQGDLPRFLTRVQPVKAKLTGDRIDSVTFTSTTNADAVAVQANYVLDATDEGDVLPVAGCEYALERHAHTRPAVPWPINGHLQRRRHRCALRRASPRTRHDPIAGQSR